MSDQDFFFDDEDEEPKEPQKKKAAASKPARSAASGSFASFLDQSVTMSITGLVALIALLLGVIVGIVLPVGGVTSDIPDPTPGAVSAPALSPEEIEGGMPVDHPDIGGSTEPMPEGLEPTVETTDTTEGGSTETTSTE